MKLVQRWRVGVSLAVVLGALCVVCGGLGCRLTVLGPERPADAALVPITLAAELRRSVTVLSEEIGERNLYRPAQYERARDWIVQELRSSGYGDVRLHPIQVSAARFGLTHLAPSGTATAWNVEVILPGTDPAAGTIVVGAHYDSKVATPGWHDHGPVLSTALGTPGANDNASGVAAILSLARQLYGKRMRSTIRFVAFANEEPPFFQSDVMGSVVYARMLRREGVTNVRMLTPETLGCYSPRLRRKRYSIVSLFGLVDRANYVAFLGNRSSDPWAREFAAVFARHARIEGRVLTLPEVAREVAWSDDWSFWQEGYPAFAVTDTAFLRHDDYHELNDTVDGIDFTPLADVVWALGRALEEVAQVE